LGHHGRTHPKKDKKIKKIKNNLALPQRSMSRSRNKQPPPLTAPDAKKGSPTRHLQEGSSAQVLIMLPDQAAESDPRFLP
jgi:hypothetical protein